METNALSVANEFVQLSIEDSDKDTKDLTLLKLVKLCYIAHGFSLANFNGHSLLNPNFDRVEAWKLGPVIPSVYHSFKHNLNNKITEKVKVISEEKWNGTDDNIDTTTPQLYNINEKAIVKFVWNRYRKWTGSDLVQMLHSDGTPWKLTYVPNANVIIPDGLTQVYFEGLIKAILANE